MCTQNRTSLLGLLLVVGLFLPCCHDMAMLKADSQHQPVSAHNSNSPNNHQDASDCNCGHQKLNNLQQTPKIAGNTSLDGQPGITTDTQTVITTSFPVLSFAYFNLDLKVPALPLHLLNSVFLH
ncbi:MAG TPA: hypothetical protein VK112_07710 [Fodinibius sp.]|nr:hypothetical protein [Fodinibius sp.]